MSGSNSNSEYISRRTCDEVEDFQDLQRTKKQKAKVAMKEAVRSENASKRKVGAAVWTKDKAVAPLSRKKGPKAKCRCRVKTFGVIVKKSETFDSHWLVKFQNGISVYCNESNLMFVSSTSQDFHLGKNTNDELCLVKFEKSCVDQEEIMPQMVVSKIYKLPGHTQYTYKN